MATQVSTSPLNSPKVKDSPKPVTSGRNGSSLSKKERKSLFDRLERVLRKLPEEPNPELENLPRKALDFAIEAHGAQKRLSGRHFVTHPLSAAELVAELVPDRATLCAALLHDVVEDTDVDSEEIHRVFGEEVGFLVDGVTKVSQIKFALQHEKQIENLRRLLVATAKDLRVIVIKLCDRLHNMKTLGSLSLEKQRRICQTTLDVYAPLAHRLGLKRLKNELEDLCLYYLYPSTYQQIKESVDQRLAERNEYAKEVQSLVSDVLATQGIEATVDWRVKHFWSIYQKMRRDGKDFSEIYDLNGIRILVDTVDQCYAVLGIVHGVWPQVVGRFKDFISKPKPNDYRSIHTTVHGPEGRLLEVQIRTHQMHRVCEEGVAAHWRYKERGRSSRRLGDDAAWIKQLSGILQDTTDQEEWNASLKTELFSDETYCYTPKGDIIRLPAGSTPIDFAYQIHTDLGDHVQGASVNGRYVPLSHQLKTGDVVQIETSKTAHPTSDWLGMVKSARARHKIRNHLLESNRETLIEQGRILLSREIHRIGRNPAIFYGSETFKSIQESLGVTKTEDLFALIGFGRVATKQVIARIIQARPKGKKTPKDVSHVGEAIRVNQIDDMLYRLAMCCQPVPGERIVGLVTKHRGISIHRASCVNIRKFQGDQARLLPLHWDEEEDQGTMLDITVEASDRKGLLADVTNAISSDGIDIRKSASEIHGSNRATLTYGIVIRDIRQLRRLASNLIGVHGVTSVYQKRGARLIRLA